MQRAPESGLEVELLPTGPEVAVQADKNQHYSEAPGNYPIFAQANQYNQIQAKRKRRPRAFLVLFIIAIVCLAVALGAGLGAGLAAQHKSSPPDNETVNAPITVTQSGNIATITPTPTTLPSPSCPATNGSTYTATNNPTPTDVAQISETSLTFEILCNTNHAEGGSVMDMQLIANASTLNDCIDACALYDFRMRSEHFPAYACTGLSWGYGFNLNPRHTCWLKSNVTLGSSNDTDIYPGYDAAVLLLGT